MNPDFAGHLEFLYGPGRVASLSSRLESILVAHRPRLPAALRTATRPALSEKDALLITYADQMSSPGESPLQALAGFLEDHCQGLINGVHLLPFYPWSSDDGFAVKDYLSVDSAAGTWSDIERIGSRFQLMFDAVFNHLSAQGDWFRRFLDDDPAFRDFFVTVEGNPDLSAVVRPRTLPLLTEFTSSRGPIKVWTTFSADQADLNLRNPEVLFALMQVLLSYLAHGARFIRLDAIAFLWKEPGTTCLHLPQTHRIIQLMRSVLDDAAPAVALITETNVPHADNLSYFGNGQNEAQLVYNFALPPLVQHAFRTGDATALGAWASQLSLPSSGVTFFNFLASHDGIGLNPVRGILRPDEIDALAEGTLARGGLISYKHNPDGTRSPYEMNINFLDGLSTLDPESDDDVLRARRHLTAHAIMLALPGVPGIYIHSLVGSRGDRAAAEATGMPRRINRARFQRATLEAELATPGSLRNVVFDGLRELLQARARHPAFSPSAAARVLHSDPALFVLRRQDREGSAVVCLQNVSSRSVEIPVEAGTPHALLCQGGAVASGCVQLGPYGTVWIT